MKIAIAYRKQASSSRTLCANTVLNFLVLFVKYYYVNLHTIVGKNIHELLNFNIFKLYNET